MNNCPCCSGLLCDIYAVPKFTTFAATAGKQCHHWIQKTTIYRQIWYLVYQENVSEQNSVMRVLLCVKENQSVKVFR
jgi:hypothetical protein